MSILIVQLYSLGTGATEEPIRFMQYRGVCNLGGDLYRLYWQVCTFPDKCKVDPQFRESGVGGSTVDNSATVGPSWAKNL